MNEKTPKSKTHILKLAILGVAILMLGIILLTVFNGDELEGTWSLDGTTIFQFDGKGEGEMILPRNTYSFKYKIDKGAKQLSIDFQDEEAEDFTYSYTVDGQHLTLFGKVERETFEYVFEKQE